MRLLHQHVLTAVASTAASVAFYYIPSKIKAAVVALLPTTNVSTDNTLIDAVLDTVDDVFPVLTTGPNLVATASDFLPGSKAESWAISALRSSYVFFAPQLHTFAMQFQALDGNREMLLLFISLLILLGLCTIVLLLLALLFITVMHKSALDRTLRGRLVVEENSQNAQYDTQGTNQRMITTLESAAILGRAISRKTREHLVALDRANAEHAIILNTAMDSKAREYEAMASAHCFALEQKDLANSAAITRKDNEHTLALQQKDDDNSTARTKETVRKDREHAHALEELRQKISKMEDSAVKYQAEISKLASDDSRTKLQSQIVENQKLHAEIRCLNKNLDMYQQQSGPEVRDTFLSEQEKVTNASNTDDAGATASRFPQPKAESVSAPAIANEEKTGPINRPEDSPTPTKNTTKRLAANNSPPPNAESVHAPAVVNEEKTAPGPNQRSRRAPRGGYEPYQAGRRSSPDPLPETSINVVSVRSENDSLDAGKAGMHESKWAQSEVPDPCAVKGAMHQRNLATPEQPMSGVPKNLMPPKHSTSVAEDRSMDNSKAPEPEELNEKFSEKSMSESRWAPSGKTSPKRFPSTVPKASNARLETSNSRAA